MSNYQVYICPPLQLVTGQWNCWRCRAPMPVAALLGENTGDPNTGPFILSSIKSLPSRILSFVHARCPAFRLTYSQTVNAKYYANNCPKCGVICGDFYLHCEPGSPFFPTEPEEAATLTIEEIPLPKPLYVESNCGYGTGELILQHARRIYNGGTTKKSKANRTVRQENSDSPFGGWDDEH